MRLRTCLRSACSVFSSPGSRAASPPPAPPPGVRRAAPPPPRRAAQLPRALRRLPARPRLSPAAAAPPTAPPVGCAARAHGANRFPVPRDSSSHRLQGRFGLLYQQAEVRRVAGRHFGQYLAVQIHARRFQAVHEFAVGDTGLPATRVDAHDPQRTEFALLVLASDVGISEGLLDGFLRRAVQLALGEEKSLRAV